MDKVRVSIIVPAHNAGATLPGCIRALLRQDLREPYEIIVVDDGSRDTTALLAAEHAPGVIVLKQAPAGASAARNRGVAAARGELVLFTDADCEPVTGWATVLVEALDAGVSGVKGTYRTRQRALTARFVQAEYESKYRRMARQSSIDFIDTYSAGYRRDVLLAVGGFDEGVSAVEDQELSFRLAERGYKLRFVPEAVVYHQHAATPLAYLRKKFWIGYWKVRVAALHPGRIISDSHTPPSLKAQMVLLCISLVSAPLATAYRFACRLLGLSLTSFLATTLPFIAWVVRDDKYLAAITPLMMLLRAAGLSGGLLFGLGRFGRQLLRFAGYSALKRVIDIVGALGGLLISAPLFAAIAVAIRTDSRGQIFFTQLRAGRDGKPFRVYKFRTMVDGAESMRPLLVSSLGLEEPVLKFSPDPRATRVGRFLRRWSLDELPQLANVLKGEMSLVGPRPEELRIVEMYSPWQRQRLRATPGMTGPMQVNGRANLSLDERVQLEISYINKASILEDFKILKRTLPAVLSGNGSL